MRVTIIMLLLAATATAKDITVSPGDSLAKTRDAAKAGDRIVLRGGTYRLDETLKLGAENSGVTWIAAPGEKPVLSGGTVITGWTADANGRYKATVNFDNFRQLWVNGWRAQRARGPVPEGLKPWGKHEAKVKPDNQPQPAGTTGTPGYTTGTLAEIAPAGYTASDASLAAWRNPGDIEFGYYNSWTHIIAKVEKIAKSPEGVVVEMAQPGFFLCHRKGGTQAGMPAYMENALELLDEPGEWYFDRPAHTLYYRMLPVS